MKIVFLLFAHNDNLLTISNENMQNYDVTLAFLTAATAAAAT